MKIAVLTLCALLSAGCITGGPASQALTNVVTVDLTAARDNFTAAGMESEATCMQKVIDKIGVEEASSLQVKGLVSLGSVAYIEYAKYAGSAKAQIPDECYVIVGKVTTAVGKRATGAFTGGLIH